MRAIQPDAGYYNDVSIRYVILAYYTTSLLGHLNLKICDLKFKHGYLSLYFYN